jgi:methionyl-tRNA formyltransferase
MRIAFFGTPEFAVPVLQSLISSKHKVVLVVSQPDRPKGRNLSVEFSPVKNAALNGSIPIMQPERAVDPEFISKYKEYSIDLNIIVAFGQILPDDVIYHPTHASVNIHASLLPKYRGASPINWALINGDEETGITYQFIEKRLDAGDIIHQEKIKINEDDDAITLFDRLSKLSGSTVIQVVDMVGSGNEVRTRQDDSKATVVRTLKKEDGRLDFNTAAKTVVNKIRGLVPWPSAYCMFKGRLLKILSAAVADCPPEHKDSKPGTITGLVKGTGFLIKTSDKCVVAKFVQPESGKKMKASDFANGHSGMIGMILE